MSTKSNKINMKHAQKYAIRLEQTYFINYFSQIEDLLHVIK